MPTQPSRELETFENPNPARDYTIEITMPEFTCLCPKTGQPDFATLHLRYIPDRKCVELKSLKLYIWSFRNEGAFHEAVTNRILGDLVAATEPRYMRLTADFYMRGGIYTTVTAEHRKPGFVNPPGPPVTDPAHAETFELSGHEPAEPLPSGALPRGSRADASPTGERFRMLARAPHPESPESATPRTEKSPAPARAKTSGGQEVFVGIDLGTSACRAVAIDAQGQMLAQSGAPVPLPLKKDSEVIQDPMLWWKAVTASLAQLLKQVEPGRVAALAVDGTSGTLLLADEKGAPVTPALMYNDARAQDEALHLATLMGSKSGAAGSTSSLAKLYWLHNKGLLAKARYALHQSDWITGMLTGRFGISDYNNSLKLGYDTETLSWPAWIQNLGFKKNILPEVLRPGEEIGPISAEIAKSFGLRPETRVVAGTTDGVASFIAAGASQTGHAVTALGSTLVLKLLSDTPVFSAEHGVYSHRLGNRWLVGGASNSGAAVLLQYFKIEQIREMTVQIDPEHLTGLAYYPLPGQGERFPVNDPNMQPILEPLPGDSLSFFQGMLEGIAGIEAHGYKLLHQLGGPKVIEIRTTGGGAKNIPWMRIRERVVGVPLKPARSDLAAYGTALLAAGLIPTMSR